MTMTRLYVLSSVALLLLLLLLLLPLGEEIVVTTWSGRVEKMTAPQFRCLVYTCGGSSGARQTP